VQSRGEIAMTTGLKGVSAAVILGVSYINNIFSPLIWALLVLIMIDILFNAHKEGQQLTKIGSAFATLSGTGFLQMVHPFSIEVIHGIVAIMVLSYIQVVVPQLVSGISKVRFLAPGTKAGVMAALAAENEALKKQAQAQAALAEAQTAASTENKVVVTPGNNQ
jgi:hypothetical protein